MHLLIIEDEQNVGAFLSRALREDAYIVDVAETGQTGLELATAYSYNAIILDVLLPGMSGIEVCRKLRRMGHRTPVMMLTARSMIEQRVEGLDAGADDYMVKPLPSGNAFPAGNGMEMAGVPKAVHAAFILGLPVDARPVGACSTLWQPHLREYSRLYKDTSRQDAGGESRSFCWMIGAQIETLA